jgi:hypothetical protein
LFCFFFFFFFQNIFYLFIWILICSCVFYSVVNDLVWRFSMSPLLVSLLPAPLVLSSVQTNFFLLFWKNISQLSHDRYLSRSSHLSFIIQLSIPFTFLIYIYIYICLFDCCESVVGGALNNAAAAAWKKRRPTFPTEISSSEVVCVAFSGDAKLLLTLSTHFIIYIYIYFFFSLFLNCVGLFSSLIF